jgi:hypothetical protein
MREISETLLAAARSLSGRPSVALDVENRRLRWALLRWEDGARYWCAQVAEGAVIHRLRANGAGAVQTCRVTDPAVAAQWTAWTTRTSEALANSDVALSAAPGILRAFYVKSGFAVRAISSTDGGNSWSAPETVASALAQAPYLAAAHQAVFALDAGQVKAYTKPGASWVLQGTWPGLSLAYPQGIGACYDGAAGVYRLIVAGDGALRVGTCNPSGWTWSAALQIAPGGSGAAASALALRGPSVVGAGEGYLVTWIDDFQGDPAAWTQAVAARSADWEHFGDEVALGIWADVERRAALAYVPSTRTAYAGNECCVCSALAYDEADEAQNLRGMEVLSFRRETDERGSRLRVEALNAAGALNPLGQAGTGVECVRALAHLVLRRGYVTAAGAERVALDPHYLVEATLTEGQGGGRLILEAVDGWGLLAMWRPTEALSWSGQSVRWLLAELCGRVGLGYADNGADSFAYAPAGFTVLPTMSGAEAVRALLRLAGGAAWFSEDGALYAVELYGYSPLERVELGEAGEVLEAAYVLRAYEATTFRVYGEGAAAAGELGTESMALGLRLARSVEDYRLTTPGSAETTQAYLWTRGRTSARRDAVVVPLRPDVELWDAARLWADEEIIPPEESLRRVVGIAEEYDGPRGRYVTRVEMEAL